MRCARVPPNYFSGALSGSLNMIAPAHKIVTSPLTVADYHRREVAKKRSFVTARHRTLAQSALCVNDEEGCHASHTLVIIIAALLAA